MSQLIKNILTATGGSESYLRIIKNFERPTFCNIDEFAEIWNKSVNRAEIRFLAKRFLEDCPSFKETVYINEGSNYLFQDTSMSGSTSIVRQNQASVRYKFLKWLEEQDLYTAVKNKFN